jgi:hypothetical protein
MTRNASERKDIRRAEKLAAEIERARLEFVVAAMGTQQGRTWFHALLSACSIFDGTFTNDALLEAFTKGQRNIGLMIYNDIVGNCPDSFVLMMKEAKIQEIVNDRRNTNERPGSSDGDGGDSEPSDDPAGDDTSDGSLTPVNL